MITIEYVPIGFPSSFGSNLAEQNCLYCSWSDIVRAGVTVGRKNWLHVVQHQKYSYFEMVYRAALIYANLKATVSFLPFYKPLDTFLIQSSAYEGLDPSEKSAISYFLGLTASELFAEKLLGVSWLMHLDVYGNKFDFKTLTDHRPDLVGVDSSNRWVVIEAKGRSNNLDKRVMQDAKRQAQSLIKIAGKKPFLHVAIASYFSSRNNALKIYAKDPPVEYEQGFELDISSSDYFTTYYSPIVDFMQSGQRQFEEVTTFQDRRFLIRRLDEADLWIGFDEKYYQLLIMADTQDISKELLALSRELSRFTFIDPLERSHQEISIGPDGIYLRLGNSWVDDQMLLEPQDRVS
jgi:hypothetical protein